MSEWQPMGRREDDNEPTVVIGTEATQSVPYVAPAFETPAERTQVMDVAALQQTPPPRPPERDAADVDPRDLPEYAYELERMQNRRLTDLGLLLLRLMILPLVLRGLYQLMHLGPLTAQMRELPLLNQAPDIAAVALGAAGVVLPVLIAVGLFTRFSALLLAAIMGLLYGLGLWTGAPVLDAATGGLANEGALLYGALALPLVFTGAGRVSVDHGLGTDRRERAADRRVTKRYARRG
ncbi:DoxX family protein [Propioniciclava coleopterorum]|uniref:DoxX family protein n=1 Tax=Propioniciclava coleopterorum TaxID=2714937 RepID=A0A6G7Y9G7_9ACTN|nr:DoxX family protein [Propioniciclava coleopterorum]QIK73462.1 DoxX family protein [Propioniciclava coleopterorum]